MNQKYARGGPREDDGSGCAREVAGEKRENGSTVPERGGGSGKQREKVVRGNEHVRGIRASLWGQKDYPFQKTKLRTTRGESVIAPRRALERKS